MLEGKEKEADDDGEKLREGRKKGDKLPREKTAHGFYYHLRIKFCCAEVEGESRRD